MSTKYVRETKAAKSVSVYVIMRGARHVATVQAHFAESGACLVNVWQESEAAERSAKARAAAGNPFPADNYKSAAQFQHGKAGGYGYDKFAAALSGLNIDGHEMTDHCSRLGAPKAPKGRDTFQSDKQAPAGYQFANWSGEGWRDCYRLPGLDYLKARGYLVISAL